MNRRETDTAAWLVDRSIGRSVDRPFHSSPSVSSKSLSLPTHPDDRTENLEVRRRVSVGGRKRRELEGRWMNGLCDCVPLRMESGQRGGQRKAVNGDNDLILYTMTASRMQLKTKYRSSSTTLTVINFINH
ncbi:hypothetical protein WUBG_09266 [Wuchereria bancrofti]|uniref:Uncharacterized protein n=1 Tax=Wuchereria bancrofti TaxID=6293 RepID=J9EBM9_WUCBA|nr:hypothetical protein WUBG_09266 [Wuchereria bancrofti]